MVTRFTFKEKQKGRITFEKLFNIIGILYARGVKIHDLEVIAKELENLLIDADINIIWSITSRILTPLVNELEEHVNGLGIYENPEGLYQKILPILTIQIENLVKFIGQELLKLKNSLVLDKKYKYDIFIIALELIFSNYNIIEGINKHREDLIDDNKVLRQRDFFVCVLQHKLASRNKTIGLTIVLYDTEIKLFWKNLDKDSNIDLDEQDILDKLHRALNLDEQDILKFREEYSIGYNREELIYYLFNSSNKEWDINIKFLGENNAADISKIIWLFSELLEGIDGVSVKLEEWGKGSLWARLKIVFSNPENQKEAKEVLQKTREALEAEKLDKYIQEKEKRNLEIEKEKIEIKNKRIETESNELDNKLKALEIEAKEIENAKAKVDLIKQIAYLAKEGMMNSQPIQIDINGKNYLTFENNKLIPGASMDEIERGEDENLRNEEETID